MGRGDRIDLRYWHASKNFYDSKRTGTVNYLEAHIVSTGCQSEKNIPLQRHLDKVHKRYLNALKALADVRKMIVTIQINQARLQKIVNNAVNGPTDSSALTSEKCSKGNKNKIGRSAKQKT